MSKTSQIRRDLQKKCLKAKRDFDKAEQKMRVYREEDIPTYNRWFHGQCGALLSEIRVLELDVQKKQWIFTEVHRRSTIRRISMYASYREVVRDLDEFDRDAKDPPREPPPENESGETRFEFSHRDDREIWEEDEKETDFPLDDNPFEEMLRRLLGIPPAEPSPDRDFEARLRGKYRELCRKLHPDAGAVHDEKTKNLWFEVQRAYEEKDIDRLENLLALSEMDGKAIQSAVTCSQILRIISHYTDGLRSIRSLANKARRNPAWGFCGMSDEDKTCKIARVKKELEDTLARLEKDRDQLNRVIEMFGKPAPPRAPRKKPMYYDPSQGLFDV